MKEELAKHNIKVIDAGVNSQADVAAATQFLQNNAQAILAPQTILFHQLFLLSDKLLTKLKSH